MKEISTTNFRFKKEFGQNFIFDKNFLNSLINEFNIDKNSNVLEIGAGMGTLSTCLANKFKKVISFEIDKTLKEKLLQLETEFNNLTFVFEDILKQNISEIEQLFNNEDYYLIANLPYYITSSIVFKFLFETTKLKSMFVMVQKEVGERFCARPNSKEYGIPSVILDAFADCRILKNVNRKMFKPVPNVDSCILQIDLNFNKYIIKNKKDFQNFVSNCFKMKRKTLFNNLVSFNIEKKKILNALNKLQIRLDARPEMISSGEYVKLFDELS